MPTDDEVFTLLKKPAAVSDEEVKGLLSAAPVLNEQHPEVERYKIKNWAPNTESAKKYLIDKGFQVKEGAEGDADYNYAIRKPGEREYRRVEKEGLDWGDPIDILTDVGKGAASAVGGLLGGVPLAVTGPGALAAGVAGAAGGGAAAELAKQGIASKLGFDISNLGSDVGKEALWGGGSELGLRAIATAAKPLIRGLKTANPLRMPLAAEKVITGQAGRDAVRAAGEGVDTARANVARALNWWDEESARRVRSLPKILSEGVDDIPIPKGARLSTEELGRMTPEAVEAAMKTRHEGTMRFLTHLIDPVWGVKAANLRWVPELRAIVQKNLGRHFRNEFGSEAMKTAGEYVKRLATEMPQEKLDEISMALGKDLAKWMQSGERLKGLGAAAKESAERMASGAGTEADAAALREAIQGTIRKPMEIVKTQQELLRARRGRDIAKGHETAFKPATAKWIDEAFAGRGGQYLRQILGAGWVGTGGAVLRGSDALGRLAELILKKSTPAPLKVAAKKTAPWAARSAVHALGR